MPFLIDTSALFKRYQPERGTTAVTRILEDHSQPLYISSITIVEMISNLKRLCEVDKITTEIQFQQQRDFFYKDIVTLNITILDITSEDVIKAEVLILKRYMKPVDSIQLAINGHQPKWTKSIAIGSKVFVEKIKAELGSKAIDRQVAADDGICELREPDVSYNANFAGENSGLKPDNSYFCDIST